MPRAPRIKGPRGAPCSAFRYWKKKWIKGAKKKEGEKKRKLEKGVRRQQERGDGKKERRRYNSRSNRRGGAVMEGEHGRGAPRLACAWGPATWGSGPVVSDLVGCTSKIQ